MRLVAIASVMAVTQMGEPVGCSADPVEVRWTGPAAELGARDVAGTFGVNLHGCHDWDVTVADDHLEVDAGWASCSISGFVRDGDLIVESEAFRISGRADQTLDFGLPSGPIGGMGAEVLARCSGVEIRAVREGYPAEMAGLRAGDRVVAVDGFSTRRASTRGFVRMATGAPGTPVELDIVRDGEPMTVRLTRERVPSSR